MYDMDARLRAVPNIYAFLYMYIRPWCILVCMLRFRAVYSPLGNERSETKTRCSKERERKYEREEGTRDRRSRKRKRKSSSAVVEEDEQRIGCVAARIGFRTVSNDTWSRDDRYDDGPGNPSAITFAIPLATR